MESQNPWTDDPFLPDHGCAVCLGHHPGRMLSDLYEQSSVCRVNNSKSQHVTARGRCYVPALGSVYRQGELGQAGWAAVLSSQLSSAQLSSARRCLPVSPCPPLQNAYSPTLTNPGHRLKICKMKTSSLKSPHSMLEMLQSSSELGL